MEPVFIIPTIGRPSLTEALNSLIAQTSESWKALVIGDGVEIHEQPDQRITTINISKLGVGRNSAGNVRNAGMIWWLEKKNHVDYFAFLDDDDTLNQNYVEYLLTCLAENENPDVALMRMVHHYKGILPPPGKDKIVKEWVGISFAIKASCFQEGFHFVPSAQEDFHLLKRLKNAGKKIIFGKEALYIVHGNNAKIYREAWLRKIEAKKAAAKKRRVAKGETVKAKRRRKIGRLRKKEGEKGKERQPRAKVRTRRRK